MLLLLNEFWPWLGLGAILVLLGIRWLNISLTNWFRLIINLLFMQASDSTSSEKKQLARPAEEYAASNPGCVLLIAGALLIIYGIIRWFS